MPDRQEMRPDTNHTSVLSGLTSDPGPQTTDSSQCFPAASPHGIILHFLLSLKISSASFPSPISEKTLLPDSPRKWKPSKETISHHDTLTPRCPGPGPPLSLLLGPPPHGDQPSMCAWDPVPSCLPEAVLHYSSLFSPPSSVFSIIPVGTQTCSWFSHWGK